MKQGSRQKMSFLVACCVIVSGALGAAAQTNTKSEPERIIYSARYYSPPGSGATSRMHLYSIATHDGKRQQLTSGRFNEDTPRLSPDGRTLAFTRMHDDYSMEVCALDLASKRPKIVLPAAIDSYIYRLQWSPRSNTLAIERNTDSNSALYLIDFPSGKTRRFSGLKNWAWRPQSTQLRLNDSKGTRLLDVVSGRETPLPSALNNTIWLNHDECARIVTKPNSPASDSRNVSVKSVEILNLQAQTVRSVAPQNLQGMRKMGNDNASMNIEPIEFDNNARLTPIPRQSTDLMLVGTKFTGSGVNSAFTRFDTQSGQTRFLARGTSLSWARDAQRFAVVDYRDMQPYGTLPNGHKGVVSTTCLMLGDGKSALRPLVLGLVVVSDCDWSR